MPSVFSTRDYKKILQDKVDENSEERGYRSRLAKAAGFQASFLSQVLNGPTHLTPEHALGIALFWQLPALERDYFVETVNYARAGTPDLRSHLAAKLDALEAQADNLHKRYQAPDIVALEAAKEYYSSWYFGAVHALSCIPEYQTAPAMARKLTLSEEKICAILLVLERLGLVRRKTDGWEIANSCIHLPKDDALNLVNHGNWRQRALLDVQDPHPEHSVHYSSVCALSRADLVRLHQRILAFLDETRNLIMASPEEEPAVLCLDFFCM